MLGNLYIIATPIGNLEDITFQAVNSLKAMDIVFAEDTRTTGNLFKRYDIHTKLESYNSVNQHLKNKEIIKYLEDGKNIGLVSDAGTPGISDPGYSAVASVREHFTQTPGGMGESPKIITIPGASALTAFVSILGMGTHAWTFYGFLPHKNGRQKMIKEMLENKNSSIFYESTHRIEKCLNEIQTLSTEPVKLAVGRELTKMFEEVLIGSPEEILEIFKQTPEKKKGEFVVMIV